MVNPWRIDLDLAGIVRELERIVGCGRYLLPLEEEAKGRKLLLERIFPERRYKVARCDYLWHGLRRDEQGRLEDFWSGSVTWAVEEYRDEKSHGFVWFP